jgi:hypothetical protein
VHWWGAVALVWLFAVKWALILTFDLPHKPSSLTPENGNGE